MENIATLHNYNQRYGYLSIVYIEDNGERIHFIAKQNVPRFTKITDKRYWKYINIDSDASDLPDTTKYCTGIETNVVDTYDAVSDTTGKNPANEGWYERSGTEPNYTYTVTSDTEPVSGKTYYTIGNPELVVVLKDQNGDEIGNTSSVALPSGLPTISSQDNGKVLIASDGKWAATEVPVADNILL